MEVAHLTIAESESWEMRSGRFPLISRGETGPTVRLEPAQTTLRDGDLSDQAYLAPGSSGRLVIGPARRPGCPGGCDGSFENLTDPDREG